MIKGGFVKLIDSMGDDNSIVQAARVSYGAGTKTVREDAKLIDYLMKNNHSTPFEMVQLKFHIKAPIFVARQWFRTRTASYNEISGRYSVIKNEYYVPDNFYYQSENNKQGTGAIQSEGNQFVLATAFHDHCEESFKLYDSLITTGLAREQARMILPLNTFTEFYFNINLHNLFRFLKQRLDIHAQFEIREYAKDIQQIVNELVPVSWEAFAKYNLEVVR